MQILQTNHKNLLTNEQAEEKAANRALFSSYVFKAVVATPIIIASRNILSGEISKRAYYLSIALIITSLALIIIKEYAPGLITQKPIQPAAFPKITIKNFLPLIEKREKNKPYLLENECINILSYLQANQHQLTAQAKNENRCIRVKAHDHLNLPRTILVTPEGKIFVVLNRTERKGDKTIGKGTFKKVKLCFELTEQKMCTHATFKNPDNPQKEKVFLKRMENEILVLKRLKKKSCILELLGTGSHTSKKGMMKHTMITPYYENLKIEDFSSDEKKEFCKELALAIQQIHLEGYAHCDIKKSNVLVDKNKHPVVIDFEGALEIKEENRGKIVGTMHSLHPMIAAYRRAKKENNTKELENHLPSLPSRDVWALGVLFLQMAKPGKLLPWEDSEDCSTEIIENKLIRFVTNPNTSVFCQPTDPTSLEYLAWNMLQVDPNKQWTLEQVISFLKNNFA